MLDQEIKNQLRELFQPISRRIVLLYDEFKNAKQHELLSLLRDITESSPSITMESSHFTCPVPRFNIQRDGHPTGISFIGIPGGHEFSSLVLGILNAAGLGKLPDGGIQQRIKNIKGSGDLRTFISLSCENCPDVVQAMNLIALYNPALRHTMVDGEFAQEEIKKLNILGVPSVLAGTDIISVGKSSLAELLDQLEAYFGVTEKVFNDLGRFDFIAVGGGPAGVSAAIYAARKGLKTALITENIGGQVKETGGIENLISIRQTKGPELAAQLAAHMADYNIEILANRRVSSIINNGHKEIVLTSGEIVQSQSIVLTTGATWRQLGIPGEKEYIGRGVGFCPHCDGPFFKGKRVAVVGGGNSGVEAAIDLAGLAAKVSLFEFLPTLKADRVLVSKLEELENVEIITNAAVKMIEGDGNQVTGLHFLNREEDEEKLLELDGVFIQIGLQPNSSMVKDLVELNSAGEIIVDENCRTSVQGIYAAGDVTTVPFKQIIISMGEGAKAALSAFQDQMIHG